MELATGSLPSRAPKAAPTAERGADPWGEFLRRFLFSTGPAGDLAEAQAELTPGAAFPSPSPMAAASGRGAEALGR